VEVHPDGILIKQYPRAPKESAYPKGNATIFMDQSTSFVDCSRGDLTLGTEIQTLGIDLGHGQTRAATVTVSKNRSR
jgi:hypothetical protein